MKHAIAGALALSYLPFALLAKPANKDAGNTLNHGILQT
jgi:hypothetical protein